MDYGILTYIRKGIKPQTFTLRMGSITLGCAPENDLVLAAEGVSDYHLRLLCLPGSCQVIDLGSTNGTFLNQVRLKPQVPQPLRNGDVLRIGPFVVRYTLAAAAAPEGDGKASETQVDPGSAGGSTEAAPTSVLPPKVLPPEVAGRLPQPAGPPSGSPPPPVQRLRGNAGPPRIPPGRRRLTSEVSSYLQYLPACYHEDEFTGQFLLIFESILDPIERIIDQMHFYLDARVAPEALLPWLAAWVDLVLNEKWPIERRRALIRAAADLYRWRGTRRGLSEYIRIYTGIEPTIIEPEPDRRENAAQLPDHVFRVILRVPDPEQIDQALVAAIIEAEKPAHTGYILEIQPTNGR